MAQELLEPEDATVRRAQFTATHWSVVLTAGQKGTHQALAALETLCRTYWYPLYAYLRRDGCAEADAKDLTQGFLARLLEKDYLRSVDPSKGRFRSFLLAAFKHYLADERDRASAQKRGAGQVPISLDAEQAEACYRVEPTHDLTPEKLYERRCALALLAKVFDRLAKDYAAAGKEALFQVVQQFLAPGSDDANYSDAARQLNMSEGAVRMAVHRLRQRYGELFREEVALTVANPDEIEDEMRHLLKVLSD